MRSLVLLMVCCSFALGQVRPVPIGSITGKKGQVPLGDASGKLDTSWIPSGMTGGTTINVAPAMAGLMPNVPTSGSSVTLAHTFSDTGYVVTVRGYKGTSMVQVGMRKWTDSLRFYPAVDSTSIEWMAQTTSSIAGLNQNVRLAGTTVTFAYPFASTNYSVATTGVKGSTGVLVGVTKTATDMTLYPAVDSTLVMWTVRSATQ